MRLPESVTVHGKEIPVIIKKLEEGHDGLTDGTKIWISENVPKRKRSQVLLHEMGHCLAYRLGFSDEVMDSKIEEIFVDNHATMIMENFILRKR